MTKWMIWINFYVDLKYMQIVKVEKRQMHSIFVSIFERNFTVYLSAFLKGKTLDVYSRLPVGNKQDYEVLKDALTEEGFKQNFRSVSPEAASTQFIARLENYLMRWIDLANIDKDFD